MKAADLAFELNHLRHAAEYYEAAVEVQPAFVREERGGWMLTERAALCRLALGEYERAEQVLERAGMPLERREVTLQRLTDRVSRIDTLRDLMRARRLRSRDEP
jgi:tetratricopeptide (TPR) repeat protein